MSRQISGANNFECELCNEIDETQKHMLDCQEIKKYKWKDSGVWTNCPGECKKTFKNCKTFPWKYKYKKEIKWKFWKMKKTNQIGLDHATEELLCVCIIFLLNCISIVNWKYIIIITGCALKISKLNFQNKNMYKKVYFPMQPC